MEMSLFWKGIVAGFLMAAPLGPMGVVCIKRTLTHGRLSGFATGLGTATIDALYSSVAAFSLVLISTFVLNHASAIQSMGAVILFYLGISIFREKPKKPSSENALQKNLAKDYGSALILTICNPITILSFMAALAALEVASNSETASPFMLVGGVFLGSLLWWIILSTTMGGMRNGLTLQRIQKINQISGSIIIVLALGLLIKIAG